MTAVPKIVRTVAMGMVIALLTAVPTEMGLRQPATVLQAGKGQIVPCAFVKRAGTGLTAHCGDALLTAPTLPMAFVTRQALRVHVSMGGRALLAM